MAMGSVPQSLKRKKILQIKSYGGITIHNYLFLCNKLNNYKR